MVAHTTLLEISCLGSNLVVCVLSSLAFMSISKGGLVALLILYSYEIQEYIDIFNNV